jgi:hypothetical protein
MRRPWRTALQCGRTLSARRGGGGFGCAQRRVGLQLRLAEIKARDLSEQLTVQMNRRSHTEHLLADAEEMNRTQAKRLANSVQNEHELEVARSTIKSLEDLVRLHPLRPSRLCARVAGIQARVDLRCIRRSFTRRIERYVTPHTQ